MAASSVNTSVFSFDILRERRAWSAAKQTPEVKARLRRRPEPPTAVYIYISIYIHYRWRIIYSVDGRVRALAAGQGGDRSPLLPRGACEPLNSAAD